METVVYKYLTRRHVILEKSNEEDIDHLIRQLATSRKQIQRRSTRQHLKVLTKIRSYSPKHKQTKEPYSPDVAETAAVDTNITTSNTPQTSRKYKNLKPTKREISP